MLNPRKILIADADIASRKMLSIFLSTEDLHICEADADHPLLTTIEQEKPALMLWDPGRSIEAGLDLLSRLRAHSHFPVIVISTQTDDIDVVRFFEAGADDYVFKPFHVSILLARISACLRHVHARPASRFLENGPIRIDLTNHAVYLSGRHVPFSRKAFQLLAALVENKGKILTYRDILCRIWGADHSSNREYVRVYIKHIRQKLMEEIGLDAFHTEPGIGYRINLLDDIPAVPPSHGFLQTHLE